MGEWEHGSMGAREHGSMGAWVRGHAGGGVQGNGEVVVRVRDHGPGIPADESGRLFRPFRKSARDAANSAPGVGLGLALSRRLARRMGGDLVVDHSVPDGACLRLTLRKA